MIFAVVVMPAMATASQAHHGIMYFVGAGVGTGFGGGVGDVVSAGVGMGVGAGADSDAGSGAIYFIVPISCS